jgi:hypothetical protein
MVFFCTFLLNSLKVDDTNSKKCLKIYKKYDHEIINKFKYILSTQNATH